MTYRVIDGFVDLEDNRHKYAVGDVFPRDGKDVSAERINLLLSRENKAGRPLIKAVEEQPAEEEEKPVVRRRRTVKK